MAQTHYTPFDVAAGQTAGGPHTDFPALILVTDNRFRTIANGGNVADGQGDDIRPYSDSALTTPITTYQKVSYDATTGALQMWVSITSLSDSTVVYLGYGDTGLTTDGSSNTTWNSAYKVVYHMEDNAASTTIVDSTSNANNAAAQANTSTKTVAGTIGQGLAFNGSSDYAVSGAAIALVNNITLETWIKDGTATQTAYGRVLETSYVTAYYMGVEAAGTSYYVIVKSDFVNTITDGAVTTAAKHIALTYDGTTATLYINGSSVGTSTPAVAPGSTSVALYIAVANGDTGTKYNATYYDETRVSSTNRSADWLLTQYRNQSAPTTFWPTGTEVAVGGGSPSPRHLGILGVGA